MCKVIRDLYTNMCTHTKTHTHRLLRDSVWQGRALGTWPFTPAQVTEWTSCPLEQHGEREKRDIKRKRHEVPKTKEQIFPFPVFVLSQLIRWPGYCAWGWKRGLEGGNFGRAQCVAVRQWGIMNTKEMYKPLSFSPPNPHYRHFPTLLSAGW